MKTNASGLQLGDESSARVAADRVDRRRPEVAQTEEGCAGHHTTEPAEEVGREYASLHRFLVATGDRLRDLNHDMDILLAKMRAEASGARAKWLPFGRES
jgi:hypothetical protein